MLCDMWKTSAVKALFILKKSLTDGSLSGSVSSAAASVSLCAPVSPSHWDGQEGTLLGFSAKGNRVGVFGNPKKGCETPVWVFLKENMDGNILLAVILSLTALQLEISIFNPALKSYFAALQSYIQPKKLHF